MTSPLDPGQARYAAMRWNTPLSVDHAEFILDLLEARGGSGVARPGLRLGELLMRAVEAGGPGTTGVGVDRDEQVLARARPLATTRGLDGRVHFVCAESATWDQRADRMLCVGASHAWAGVEQALQALARLVRPGGRVLFGEGCWERSPTAAAAASLGEPVAHAWTEPGCE